MAPLGPDPDALVVGWEAGSRRNPTRRNHMLRRIVRGDPRPRLHTPYDQRHQHVAPIMVGRGQADWYRQ